MRRAKFSWLRSEEHTSELQSRGQLVCRLLLEKKKRHDLEQVRRHAPREREIGGRAHDAAATCLGGQGRPLRQDVGFFFFNDTATTEIYTLSLHDALPISPSSAITFGDSGAPATSQKAAFPAAVAMPMPEGPPFTSLVQSVLSACPERARMPRPLACANRG